MNGCLDSDALVSVGSALAWDVDTGLRHLMHCEECREQLRRLATIRRTLDATIEPAPGFVETVVQSVPRSSPAPLLGLSPLALLNSVLAAVTAFFALVSVGPALLSLRSGVPAVVVSLAAAGVTLLWNVVRREEPAGTPGAPQAHSPS